MSDHDAEAVHWRRQAAGSVGLTEDEAEAMSTEDVYDLLQARRDEVVADCELDIAAVRVLGSPERNIALDALLQEWGHHH